MRYAHYDDRTIGQHFMPRYAVPDYADWVERGHDLAAEARARWPSHLDLAYGPGPLQKLDIFPAAKGPAPVHVYIHGGYWRALDKSGYSFIGEKFARAGICTILLNYDLCPTVTVDHIVEEIAQGLIWIWKNAGAYGGDANRLTLSGSSVGAHLTAMMLARDWSGDPVPPDLIKAAVLMTGIYDLEPVLRIEANQDIRLDAAMAARNSPLFLAPRRICPAIVAVGGAEPALWIAQSQDFARHLQSHGLPTRYLEVPGAHHFSINQTIAEPQSLLAEAILSQFEALAA